MAALPSVEGQSAERQFAGWGSRRQVLFLAAWFVAVVMAAFWLAWIAILAGAWRLDFVPVLDFFTFYAASTLALDGVASSAYEAEAIWRAEAEISGDSSGYLAWLNPPTFFFVVLPLSLIPVAPSFVTWVLVTGAFAFSAVYRMAVDKPLTLLLAAVFPASLANLLIGHNAYLMAGALAWGMLLLRDRPVLAGAALSLLAFKPQFFPLVLVALIAGRDYRAASSAVACAAALALLSVPAFGLEAWAGFLDIGQTYATRLYEGSLDLRELHSFSAVLLLAGVPELAARVVQVALAGACAAWLWLLWRGDAAFEYKAAGLGVGMLLASPYSYVYDFTLMGLAILWLAVAFHRDGWRRWSVMVMAAAWLAPFGYILLGFSVTPLALMALVIAISVSSGAIGKFQKVCNTRPALRFM